MTPRVVAFDTDPFLANVVAIGILGGVNFASADRLVFAARTVTVGGVMLALSAAPAFAADLTPQNDERRVARVR